jgi:hypothetical protein
VSQRHHGLPDGVETKSRAHENRAGRRLRQVQQSKEQVLASDVSVAQPVGLVGRVLQHRLGVGRDRNLDVRGDLRPSGRRLADLHVHGHGVQPRAFENPAGQPLAFPQQAEEEMLGFDGCTA